MEATTDHKDAESVTIVIDNGSYTCRAGVAGEDSPRSVFPELVGKPKTACIMFPIGIRNMYIGDEAQSKAGVLKLSYPIQYGLVTNWDEQQAIWHHTFFNELRYDAEACPTLITELPYNPTQDRTRMAGYFFESLHTPALYMACATTLPLFITGRMTGIVVESGHTVTLAAAVYEGYTIRSTVRRVYFGGRDLTDYFMYLERQRGYNFSTTAERAIVADIKEHLVFVAQDFDNIERECAIQDCDNKNYARHRYQHSYELPDGQTISFCQSRFQVGECLFRPALTGKDFREAIHTLPWMSLRDCDLDIQPTMAANIVLSGGSTLMPGLPERLERELRLLLPPKLPLRILAYPERKYGAWLGGSIIASLSSFRNMYVTSEEYKEHGANIIQRKCY